jgi:hypothetical protein
MSNRKAARGGGIVGVSSNVATGTVLDSNENNNKINETKEESNNDDVIMINNNKRQLTLESNKNKNDDVQTAVIKEEFGKEVPRRKRRENDELDPDEQAIVDLCNSCASCCIVF